MAVRVYKVLNCMWAPITPNIVSPNVRMGNAAQVTCSQLREWRQYAYSERRPAAQPSMNVLWCLGWGDGVRGLGLVLAQHKPEPDFVRIIYIIHIHTWLVLILVQQASCNYVHKRFIQREGKEEMGKADKSKALDLTSAARGVWLIKVNVFAITNT